MKSISKQMKYRTMDVTIIKLKPGTKANKLKFSVNCVDPICLILSQKREMFFNSRPFFNYMCALYISQKLSEQLVQKLKSYIEFLFKSQICLINIMAYRKTFFYCIMDLVPERVNGVSKQHPTLKCYNWGQFVSFNEDLSWNFRN